LIEHSHDPDVVSGGDRSEERKQRTVVELVGSPTCLRHEYRLPVLVPGSLRRALARVRSRCQLVLADGLYTADATV
jgi:hypothetical protein